MTAMIMTFAIPMPPITQAHRGERERGEADRRAHLVERADDLVRGRELEVVGLVRGEAPQAAQDGLDLHPRGVALPGLRAHVEDRGLGLGEAALGRPQRDEDHVVVAVLPEEAALARRLDADDRPGLAGERRACGRGARPLPKSARATLAPMTATRAPARRSSSVNGRPAANSAPTTSK